MNRFAKGSPEAREYMAHIRKMGGSGRKKNAARTGTRAQLRAEAKAVGLSVDTWSPGDGKTRYRFFPFPKGGYFEHSQQAVKTVKGIKAAFKFVAKHQRGSNPAMLVIGNPGKKRACPSVEVQRVTAQAGLRELKQIAGKHFQELARAGVGGKARKIKRGFGALQREAIASDLEMLKNIRAAGGVIRPAGITGEEWRNQLPRSFHHRRKKGAGIPLDVLAQDLYDQGMIKDPYGDDATDYINKLYDAVRAPAEQYDEIEIRKEARKIINRQSKSAVKDLVEAASTSTMIAKCPRGRRNKNPAMLVIGNPMNGPADPHAATELRLFIDNDADLYRQQYTPIIQDLMRKRAAGKYGREKSVKLWMYLAESGAKKYCRQFCASESDWKNVFNKNTRLQVSRALRDSFEAEAELGNYDDYIPKKYRKNPSIVADIVSGAAFGAGGIAAESVLRKNPNGNIWILSPTRGYAPMFKGTLSKARLEAKRLMRRSKSSSVTIFRAAGGRMPGMSLVETIKRKKNPSSGSGRAVARRRRGNPELPANLANDPAFKKELRAYRKRHGAGPVEIKKIRVPKGFPKFMSVYGRAAHAVYDAPPHSNKGKRIHHFGKKGKKGSKPWLVSSAARGPKFLAYVGGTFAAQPAWIYT